MSGHRHLPKLDPKASPNAVCGAPAMAAMDTTVAQCDCMSCLWAVYGFLTHQQNLLVVRLRSLAGVTYRSTKRVVDVPTKKDE